MASIRSLVVTCGLFAAPALGVGCASSKGMGADEARTQVQQLMTLYKDDRAKFVIQKQKLQQADSCADATALAQAAKKWEDEANMQPGDTMEVSQLHRELDEAEKVCRAK
jgi:hypothetical protein